jgi:hypothetical protein
MTHKLLSLHQYSVKLMTLQKPVADKKWWGFMFGLLEI